MHRAIPPIGRTLLLTLLAVSTVPAAAQEPAAERLHAQAQRLLEGGDADAALEEFQLLVQQFPEDRLAPRALLQVAEIRRAQGDLESTRRALEKLLSDYGRSLESAAAFVMQAEIEVEGARRLADVEEARNTFRRVPLLYGRESYPDLESRMQARIRSGELSLQLGDDESAVAEFLAAVEDEPAGPRVGRAKLLLATALRRRGDWIAACEVLQRLASETGTATSSAVDRASALRQLSLIHRRIVRPRTGQSPWLAAGRYPASGLHLKEPAGVAAAEDGRLLIVDEKLPLIALVGADGQVVQRSSLRAAGKPGWSAGAAYVATESGISLPFDDAPSPRFLEPRPGKERPLEDLLAAERGPFGDWFLAAKAWKSLLSFESPRQSQELLAADRPEIVDLAQDDQGRIYALDRRAQKVLRLGADRHSPEVVIKGSGWKRPVALDVDGLGNLYVLDRGNGTVEVFDPEGRRTARLGPTLGGGVELRSPADLAVDGSGRLFIADAKLPFVVMLD